MGEVYKAKDTRLERTVAIKVLPSHLSSSEEVRQRFEREAKTISSLSHPHIWGPDGREIFYRKDKKVLRVAVTTSPVFSASRPELLFEGDCEGWDIARDGKRFLMVKDEAAESAPKHLNLVLDWFEDLNARGPAGRKR